MSVEKRTHRSRGPALWPFIAGFAFIALATINNFAFGMMTSAEIDALPEVIAAPYQRIGAFGMAIGFVSLGVGVMIVAMISHLVEILRRAALRRVEGTQHAFALASMTESGSTSGSSFMALETAKYLDRRTYPEVEPAMELETSKYLDDPTWAEPELAVELEPEPVADEDAA